MTSVRLADEEVRKRPEPLARSGGEVGAAGDVEPVVASGQAPALVLGYSPGRGNTRAVTRCAV